MKRVFGVLYGGVSYLLFLLTFLYMIAFIGDLPVPKTIDSGAAGPGLPALLADLGLIALFGIQHSLMARPAAKRWLGRLVPAALERSTYVLLTGLLLLLLAWQWQPLPGLVWEIRGTALAAVIQGLFGLGWLIVLLSSFLINHFELFGLQQVYFNLIGKVPSTPRFQTPWLYKLVRHPMMLGLLIAFWAAPRLSLGHLLFAAGMTAYILVGIQFEERDLAQQLGEDYVAYQRQTPMLIPMPHPNKSTAPAEAARS